MVPCCLVFMPEVSSHQESIPSLLPRTEAIAEILKYEAQLQQVLCIHILIPYYIPLLE